MNLNTKEIGKNLIWLDEVDSTNTYLKDRCLTLPHGTAVFTDRQTSGKGRRGHQWSGDSQLQHPGASVAVSILLRDAAVADMGILPLLCALAVRRGVGAYTGQDIGIKWPNDMICQGKKLCGILCESRITAHQGQGDALCAICGIGVNLSQSGEDFARLQLPHAISLQMATGKRYTPEEICAAILEGFEQVYTDYRTGGFSALLPEYRQGCVTLGKTVRVIWDQQEKEGVALDINPQGELLCSIDHKVQVIRSGEASVRGLYGYL